LSEGNFVSVFIRPDTTSDLIRQFAHITNFHFFPIFSLDFHQSRWGYLTKNEVEIVIRGLESSEIHSDSFWLDLYHFGRKKPFTIWSSFPVIGQLYSLLGKQFDMLFD
jgi:alpha-glucosidase (family GH31 glycosyl hydrolase)